MGAFNIFKKKYMNKVETDSRKGSLPQYPSIVLKDHDRGLYQPLRGHVLPLPNPPEVIHP
jgi:hypothetical protein